MDFDFPPHSLSLLFAIQKYRINLCHIICCSFKFETCCDKKFWYQNRWKKISNNNDSLDRLYKREFFLTQTKIENWQKTAKLTFLCYDILVKKGSLHRNGNAAIPKVYLTGVMKSATFLDVNTVVLEIHWPVEMCICRCVQSTLTTSVLEKCRCWNFEIIML